MDNMDLLEQAQEFFARDDFVETEVLCKRIIKSAENIPGEVFHLLGRLAVKCADPEAVIFYYEKYFDKAGEDRDSLLNIASACKSLGRNNKASTFYLRACQLCPEDDELQNLYFQHCYDCADFDHFPCEDYFRGSREHGELETGLRFHAVAAVWGASFTSLYADYILPTHLGADNIEVLSRDSRALYVIYTTPEDAAYIKESRAFELLVEKIDVRFYFIESKYIENANKYDSMSQFHRHAFKKAAESSAHLIVISPDLVVSRTLFDVLYKRAAQGFKAVMMGTIRVSRSGFQKALQHGLFTDGSEEQPLKGADLVKLSLEYLHSDTKRCFVNSSEYTGWPSSLIWEIPGEGVVCHNFHLHPVMVYPGAVKSFDGPVDGDCVMTLCSDFSEVYIVRDSDEAVAFDLTLDEVQLPATDRAFCMDSVIDWMKIHTNEFHREYVRSSIVSHYKPLGERGMRVLGEAESFVDKVLAYPREGVSHTHAEVLTDDDLMFPAPLLDLVNFQVTSKCNLKCVYCPQCWSKEKGQDMSPALTQQLVDFIIDRNIRHTGLGFYGEALIHKDWYKYADQLIDHGTKVRICSNFNMRLSAHECHTLSRLDHIQFSIDSADAGTLKEVRPPADISTMLLNMHKIRAAAIGEGRRPPVFQWCGTLTDKVVPQLIDLLSLAVSNGVTEFNLNELVYFDDRELPVKSIFTLQGEEFIKAVDLVYAAREFAAENGIKASILPVWDKLFESKMRSEQAESQWGIKVDIAEKEIKLSDGIQHIQGVGRYHSQKEAVPGPGETRACLFPWSSAYVMPRGDVYTCCIRGKSMGRVGGDVSVENVMHNADYLDLRKQLITGNIVDPTCKICPIASVVPVKEQKRNVADYIRRSRTMQREGNSLSL